MHEPMKGFVLLLLLRKRGITKEMSMAPGADLAINIIGTNFERPKFRGNIKKLELLELLDVLLMLVRDSLLFVIFYLLNYSQNIGKT